MDPVRIERIFDECFATEQTLLIGGADEPYYLPHAHSPDHMARLYYRSDYVSSALHEISHWCIAGRERRLKPDFGYWYNPDGRTASQQLEFYRFEVKPQALEWIFSETCGVQFNLSADNLGEPFASTTPEFLEFLQAVTSQKQLYSNGGLPPRGHRFFESIRKGSR